ncbi:hypothetical protein EQ875_01665 [Photobacterium damselae subsp. damselae]|uniref:hypothetical protein n=1 Tax=Photobacterium damselae TaxID=38293 RepID=UPI001139DFE6|nr:hypothetical protein [Photobacterium damselae]TGZ35384.1 hypothetical protein EQ875_01665 [Photobacterium damselae subsp. damselae]
MNQPHYAFYWDGVRHTCCDTEYLQALGMDDEGIESLQASAKWNAERSPEIMPA